MVEPIGQMRKRIQVIWKFHVSAQILAMFLVALALRPLRKLQMQVRVHPQSQP